MCYSRQTGYFADKKYAIDKTISFYVNWRLCDSLFVSVCQDLQVWYPDWAYAEAIATARAEASGQASVKHFIVFYFNTSYLYSDLLAENAVQ